MKRILFVDDEPSVLTAACNSLRSRRAQWAVVLAFGFDDALEELAKGPFDVIVCDLHMPGGTGEQLLQHVQTSFPAVKRLVLSGDLTPQTAQRLAPLCHKFLEKPCSSEDLQQAIEQAVA